MFFIGFIILLTGAGLCDTNISNKNRISGVNDENNKKNLPADFNDFM